MKVKDLIKLIKDYPEHRVCVLNDNIYSDVDYRLVFDMDIIKMCESSRFGEIFKKEDDFEYNSDCIREFEDMSDEEIKNSWENENWIDVLLVYSDSFREAGLND